MIIFATLFLVFSTPSDPFFSPYLFSLPLLPLLSLSLPSSGIWNRTFCDLTFMASQDKGRPLPKFGEWDVSNPASAEGFTVIFNKARDEKKTNGHGGANIPPQKTTGYKPDHDYDFPTKRKWFCCG